MNSELNDNIAQKKNDDDEKKNETVQPVQKQIDEFKSHFLQNYDPIFYLGKGGFGIVLKAKDKLTQDYFAIKRMPFPSQQESRDRVKREVEALSKLEHKHIVKYYHGWVEEPPRSWQEEQDSKWMPKSDYMDISSIITTSQTQDTNHCPIESCNDKSDLSYIVFDTNNKNEILDISSDNLAKGSKQRKYKCENDTTSDSQSEPKETIRYLYIKMELCQKNTLRDWLLQTKNRDKNYILKIFGETTLGVEYIHKRRLIHRDLKPPNIFFSLDNKIKIGDFGLVTKMNDSDPKTGHNDEQHTNQVGTQLYMSPEQIRGNPYNFKVDIYSLGVIFFELLNEFTTDTERCQTLKKLREGKMPDEFSELYKDTPEVIHLVCNMLSQSPEERYTASEIINELSLKLNQWGFHDWSSFWDFYNRFFS